MSDTGNYCKKHKEFEDVPPSFSGDTEVKWIECSDCGYMKQKGEE